jgi:hypothetical protein
MASNGIISMNNELGIMRKEAVMAQFEVLFQILPGRIKEQPQSS